jgi:hypothetical protein
MECSDDADAALGKGVYTPQEEQEQDRDGG